MAESPLHLLVARSSATVIEVAETFPPYTTPSLTANLVCRVSLAIIANLVCLVPLRLLYRNGELAAVIFILSVEIKNLETIVNAFIWRNDDVSSWWAGYGWCDFDNHLHNIVIGFFVTCLLAIVRNLAHQVGLMRANALTAKEKQRRNWIQALIIFPFPIIQLALTHPVTAQRYIVGSLMGCDWVAHNSWPFLVFFVLPPPIFAFVTAAYASKFNNTKSIRALHACMHRIGSCI
jgi:pheromone a factor receptor